MPRMTGGIAIQAARNNRPASARSQDHVGPAPRRGTLGHQASDYGSVPMRAVAGYSRSAMNHRLLRWWTGVAIRPTTSSRRR